MFNSINNPHRRKEDNPMNSLSFIWQAIFNDDSILTQFNGDKEINFNEVKKRFSELKQFKLRHRNTNQCFVVDLENGLIFGSEISYSKESSEEIKNNIRLIFFRRHKVDLNAQLEELNHNIEYHLGYQYNDNEGKNRQIIIIIDKDGNWYLGG